MIDNPYIYVLVSAFVAAGFIIVTGYLLASLARWIVKARGATPRKQENTFAGYLFASPWIVGFLIFVVVPLGFSLYWSFTDYRIAENQAPNWVGFENYKNLILEDEGFRASMANTLFLTVIGLPVQMAVALFLAVLLNQKTRGERVFRMAFYLPVILGFNTAVLLCWRLMLNTGTGIINQLIRSISTAFPPFGYLNRSIIFIQELISAFFLGVSSGKFNLLLKVWEAGFPAENRIPLWVQSACLRSGSPWGSPRGQGLAVAVFARRVHAWFPPRKPALVAMAGPPEITTVSVSLVLTRARPAGRERTRPRGRCS